MRFWEERFKLNLPIIDIQHKRLFDLISEMNDTIDSSENDSYTSALLEELKQYTLYHFEAEERLFKHSDYDKVNEHCTQHEKFKENVAQYYKDYKNGDKDLKIKACIFLQNWWQIHVLEVDKTYVPYVKG